MSSDFEQLDKATNEKQLLLAQLEKMGFGLVGITLGDNPGNAETVARELRKSLERLEAGDYEVEEPFDQFGEPSNEKIQKDLGVLAVFQARADQIQDQVRNLKKDLAKDLMNYAEQYLRPYSYGMNGIENAVNNIVQTANLDEYDPKNDQHFWLPSNFGC